jgi:hypothetical protein
MLETIIVWVENAIGTAADFESFTEPIAGAASDVAILLIRDAANLKGCEASSTVLRSSTKLAAATLVV